MNSLSSYTFKFVSFILLLIASNFSFSQGNNLCATASPFCTGTPVSYPAATNAGSAQQGPNYACLGSQPNPAWFSFQIATAGSLVINMSATSDIDFIAWGPFPTLQGNCGNLNSGTQVPNTGPFGNPTSNGCSFSGSNTETLVIANAVPGQNYILLITNFSNQQQTINFNQTNAASPGAGATNCGLVCLISPTNSGRICSGNNATLSINPSPLTSTSVVSYTWFAPGGFSTTTSPLITPNFTSSVTYTVKASTASSTCQAFSTVSVVAYPQFSVSQTFTQICQGGNFNAAVIFTSSPPSNPTQFAYLWTP